MNKVLNILLSIVFLISFIGIQINKHYSHGKLYSVAFYHEAQTCCDPGATPETADLCKHHNASNGVCENQSEFHKINLKFVGQKLSVPAVKTIHLLLAFQKNRSNANPVLEHFSALFSPLSPPFSKTDSQSGLCVFRC